MTLWQHLSQQFDEQELPSPTVLLLVSYAASLALCIVWCVSIFVCCCSRKVTRAIGILLVGVVIVSTIATLIIVPLARSFAYELTRVAQERLEAVVVAT